MAKVFFLLPDLSAGGAERVSITFARLLKKEEFDVEFVNFGHSDGEMLDWIVPEFKLTSFGLRRSLAAIPTLGKFMRKNRDAIYFSSREHVNIISLISSKYARTSSVVRIPNMPKNVLVTGMAGFKAWAIKKVNRWILRSAKTIIAQNDEMKKQLIDFYDLPENLVQVINNPVDKDYIHKMAADSISPFHDCEINFVSICNIAYSKGIDVLEDAWPRVKAVLPSAHMYIIGRDTSEYALKMKKKAESLKDFTFLGFQGNPYPYLKYCDCFVLPSRMEGFPNVILEAMCFDKPIASTNCVKIIEEIILPDINGYFCQVSAPDFLADCMIKASQLKSPKFSYNLFGKGALIKCFK